MNQGRVLFYKFLMIAGNNIFLNLAFNVQTIKRLIICVFLFSYFLGLLLGVILCNLIPTIQNEAAGSYSVISQLSAMTSLERFWFIVENNVMVGLKSLFGGMLTLGLFPILNNVYGAFVFGVVLGKSLVVISIEDILYSTLPHCFEIVGIVGMGYIGTIVCISFFCKEYCLSFKRILLLFLFSFSLIVISAFVESYISIG